MDQPVSLRSLIASSVDTLSPKQKQIARFILDDPYFTSFASANELGEKNNTTAATVVRFSQTLGFEGYPQLQDALRSELPNYMTTTARMQKRMSAQTPPTSNPQQVFFTDINNIERTANNVSEDNLNIALDAIIKARRIWVIGAGLSYAPAAFLTHSLKVMGFDALGIQREVLQSAVDISRIRPDDLMIAIDLWRYVRMTVNAVSQAKKIGTPVIAITDSIVSPLAQMADIAFEIAAEGIVHSLSITAVMSLLNVFIAMLADRVPEQVYESLKRVDDAYRSNDLLITS
jgi:DNA-binding MurR/RpiR family transcriptional regulator